MKPRGSVKGIVKHKKELKNRNRENLINAIKFLESAKPYAKWKYKEVWIKAGLKSAMALNSKWNEDIKSLIDAHNNNIADLSEKNMECNPKKEVEKDRMLILEEKIASVTKERDSALEKISIYQADALFYKEKCEHLQEVIKRLTER
ncbi:hypothetical protein [Halomonas sp. LBP4]|uniref:hypothetical protein n=1 Tax=Halomonas sp. LBP4 TaxID=2044917 RepID=UPI0011B58399|nr:hypothetical protein [Halomonas sp. LBP4]